MQHRNIQSDRLQILHISMKFRSLFSIHIVSILDKLSLWESQWDMEFNPSKCQVVRVTTARKAINTVYTLHGQILEVVTSAKYLGVDISSGLSWNSHIDRITGNANRTLGYIRRNIKSKHQKVRETAYNNVCPTSAGVCGPYLGSLH